MRSPPASLRAARSPTFAWANCRMRPARADSRVKHGLKIESPVGNALLTPSLALRATGPAESHREFRRKSG